MRRLTALAALPLIALAAQSDQRAPDSVTSALGFLATLDKDRHDRAVMPFDSDYRTLWRYTPATRQGISWKDLDSSQTKLAQDFIRNEVGDLGSLRTELVRKVEQVLAEIEGSPRRDKDNYLITFFGVPSTQGKWGWRYEGHHISLNLTYDGNRRVSSSPQFFGSNPAEVPIGEHKGLRMLAKEEDLAIELLASLTEGQRKIAIISGQAPNEIFTAENQRAARQGDQGITYDQLTPSQQKGLLALIRANAKSQKSPEITRRLTAIEKAGYDKIQFAWMGAPDRSAAHYYRIQGPTFLIEFDNSQNRANHIHLVWRDFEGDFGRDVLKEHYEQHRSDKSHGHDH
ncbi:MAG: DUF3500 domain-containing protein [Fimbriimonadaceae bacterium]